MSETIPERVAVLEAKQEEFIKTQTLILDKVSGIESQITRYHGFLGGIAFLLTGVGICWNMFGDWIKSHLR